MEFYGNPMDTNSIAVNSIEGSVVSLGNFSGSSGQKSNMKRAYCHTLCL